MDLVNRAKRHAALGDRIRLALVDDLATSDRSPAELADRHDLASNLLAHHLDVLEDAGLIERNRSSGDGRKRYVHLRRGALPELTIGGSEPGGPVLFVCTHNSARSQLAAAAWSATSGITAVSAGTHPAGRVHPGAVATATRAGLDLSGAVPKRLEEIKVEPEIVVTVCDRAHEELQPGPDWWHWSIPDPVGSAAPDAFDRALQEIMMRIRSVTRHTDL